MKQSLEFLARARAESERQREYAWKDAQQRHGRNIELLATGRVTIHQLPVEFAEMLACLIMGEFEFRKGEVLYQAALRENSEETKELPP